MSWLPRRLAHGEEATLPEHLDELRGRLFVIIGALVLGTILAYRLPRPPPQLAEPAAAAAPPHVVTLGVVEPFSITLTVCVYAGLVLALPVVLWQLWSFFAPAMEPAAERKMLALVAFSVVLARRGSRVRLRGAPAARDPLPHELRHEAFPSPDPGEAVLQLRRHRAPRDRRRVPDAARRARPRLSRRPQLQDAASASPDGLLHHRSHRARAARPGSRHDVPRVAADVGALRGIDLARILLRAALGKRRLLPRLRWAADGARSGKGETAGEGEGAARQGAPARAAPAQRRRQPESAALLRPAAARQKWLYAVLALVFAVGFAGIGVGSGRRRPEQLYTGLFGGGGELRVEGAGRDQDESGEGIPRPRHRVRVEERQRPGDERAAELPRAEEEGRKRVGRARRDRGLRRSSTRRSTKRRSRRPSSPTRAPPSSRAARWRARRHERRLPDRLAAGDGPDVDSSSSRRRPR